MRLIESVIPIDRLKLNPSVVAAVSGLMRADQAC
jgi:hypothetical protein